MPKKKTYNVVWDGGLATNELIGRLSVTGTVDLSPAAAVFTLGDVGLASMAAFNALSDKDKMKLMCKQLAKGHLVKLKKVAKQAVPIEIEEDDD